MYYQLSTFYKRDIYFQYAEENSILYDAFEKGESVDFKKEIIYLIDKIDDYLNDYDILPTYNTPLVSSKFMNLFKNHEKEVQFLKATIIDKKGNRNNTYYVPNILNMVPCLDKERSIIEEKKYGSASIMTIKKLYITPNSIQDFSIIRMKEKKSYIIVTEEFKRRCEDAKLKGFNFIEEGHSIYKDIQNIVRLQKGSCRNNRLIINNNLK